MLIQLAEERGGEAGVGRTCTHFGRQNPFARFRLAQSRAGGVARDDIVRRCGKTQKIKQSRAKIDVNGIISVEQS